MRVTLLNTFHRSGGAAVAANRLHQAFLQHGLDSTLLTGAPTQQEKRLEAPAVVSLADSFWGDQLAFARFVGERLYFLPYEKSKAVRFHFSPATFGADLARHPAVQQADVLHLHWINFGFLSLNGLDDLLRLGKPIVWTLHDTWPFTGGCHYPRGCEHFKTHCHQCPYLRKPGEHDLAYRIFRRKTALLKGARIHFTPPSRWMQNEAQSGALLRDFPFTVIPNPVDQSVFAPQAREEVTRQLNLAADRPRLLFGSFNTTDPRKGFAFFVEALRILKQHYQGKEPEIILFGKSNPADLEAVPYPVRSLGVLRTEEAVAMAYNATDALVVPSLEDNLPNTVAEALSCGTPVIGFKTGGIPEMIDHQQNGYLATAGSAAALAQGLAWLLNHTDRTKLRQEARLSAERRYSGAVITRQFNELYHSLL